MGRMKKNIIYLKLKSFVTFISVFTVPFDQVMQPCWIKVISRNIVTDPWGNKAIMKNFDKIMWRELQ